MPRIPFSATESFPDDEEFQYKNPVEYTIRLEQEQIDQAMKTSDREIESLIEEILANWFGKVQVL